MSSGTGKGTPAVQIGVIRGANERHSQKMRTLIELRSPVQDHLKGYAEANLHTPGLKSAAPDSYKGKTLALCGAGPSLRTAVIEGVDEVFGCNSALTYLADKGQRVTGGVSVDQTDVMLRDWANPPDVPLFVASTCNPALITHLTKLGRDLRFFHNFVGFDTAKDAIDNTKEEFDYYCEHWPNNTIFVGSGMTVVSRFLAACPILGFERIDVYGVDCCFGEDDIAHANGESAETAYGLPIIQEGVINGRTYRTRPDMLMEAVIIAKMVKMSQGRVRLMGDTLPVALLGKSDEFLDSVCVRLAPGELPPDLKII